MSDLPKCPGCGAAARQRCDESEPTEDRLFWCGRLERVIKGRMWDVIESETCFRRQLAQRDERNAALEARALRMERALRTIEAWPFNIMGDCVADARALARKALEE